MDTRREFLKKASLLSAGSGLLNALPPAIARAMAIDPDPGTTYLDFLRATVKRGHYSDTVGREEEWIAGTDPSDVMRAERDQLLNAGNGVGS